MNKMGLTLIYLWLVSLCSCQQELIEYEKGDVKVCIEQGEQWLLDFPLFLGINKKNPPQIAVWLEDTQGNYLSTVYVTHKIATQSWQASGGNRRKEALPHWCYSRGVKYDDGLYLPTKKEPLTDGISGATPHGSFDIKLSPAIALKTFIVKIEIYAANVDLSAGKKSFEANLVGHSSPNGSSGKVSKDTSGLTTALHIVKRITVIIQ